MKRGYRVEKDYLGSKKIPSQVYYGIATQRALENFPISGLHFSMKLVQALAMIKKAAAIANKRIKRLDENKANAIVRACEDVIYGKLNDQFPLDVFQAGAGTSEHMNINEVIANRALEILHKTRGSYGIIDPHDHVNLGQSTNDVFHSAIHVAAYQAISKQLFPALHHVEEALQKKSREWKSIKKTGRTHLRDAVPLTLGQEFGGYAATIANDRKSLGKIYSDLLKINLGGTAVGTSVNAPERFRKSMYKELYAMTRAKFHPGNLFGETQSLSTISSISSSLKVLAEDLIKIANDLRLLSSGPTSGIDEVELPAVQPGSSIMPGKVNPSIAEMVDMVGFYVISNDTAITLCSQAGQLELNVMMPLAAHALIHSIEVLTKALDIFSLHCINGMKAHKGKIKDYVEKNPLLVTALTPHIGYQKASSVVQQAYMKGKTIREIILEQHLMDEETLNKALK
ncbi:aspartate ammonia-lyase [Candidatus Pacearchaeota archaeon]|nr:aspartate ammonia-lyase [Candidatus Pacearchaeota archaeon]